MDKIESERLSNILLSEVKHEHGLLVSKISEIMAKSAGFNEKDIHIVKESSRLHDIGKNYVPKSILNKPWFLTEAEFEIIKTHTKYGFNFLIQQAKIYIIAAIIALQHHEKTLGQGYAGVMNVHAYAKLVAVADVFDALMSKRAYKESWSEDEAVGYIQTNADKEFDAYYVDVFTRSLDDILKIYSGSDS
jgi:HD-GYP domain-containing protein (c-di-GMP phosphodiesterase class II)